MKNRKRIILIPLFYLIFTFVCGALGLALGDERGILFVVWFSVSLLLWLSLCIWVFVINSR